jgi:hypothetical protein
MGLDRAVGTEHDLMAVATGPSLDILAPLGANLCGLREIPVFGLCGKDMETVGAVEHGGASAGSQIKDISLLMGESPQAIPLVVISEGGDHAASDRCDISCEKQTSRQRDGDSVQAE